VVAAGAGLEPEGAAVEDDEFQNQLMVVASELVLLGVVDVVRDRRDAAEEQQGVDWFGGMAGERGEVRGRLPSGGGGRRLDGSSSGCPKGLQLQAR
jgi:hypothetical protein